MKELYDIFILLKKWRRAIWFSAVFLGFLTFLLSLAWPTSYRALVTVYVQRVPEKVEGVYNYDGYYASQTAENYTDTVKGLISSLDVIKRAAEISGLWTDPTVLKELTSQIKVTKQAPQLVLVAVTSKDREEAKKVALSLAQAAAERARLLNQDGDTNLNINVVNPDPLVETLRFESLTTTIIGFFFGLLFGFLGVAFYDYWKNYKITALDS